MDRRTILENYDLVALCIDEICDDGYDMSDDTKEE